MSRFWAEVEFQKPVDRIFWLDQVEGILRQSAAASPTPCRSSAKIVGELLHKDLLQHLRKGCEQLQIFDKDPAMLIPSGLRFRSSPTLAARASSSAAL